LHEEAKAYRRRRGDRMERTAPSEGGREEMRLKDGGHLSLSSRALPGGHARRVCEKNDEANSMPILHTKAMRSVSVVKNREK
jgi:hypothetical protein